MPNLLLESKLFLGKCSEQIFLKASLIHKGLILFNNLTLYFSSIQTFSMSLDVTVISVICSLREKCPNTERYGVYLSECGRKRTRKTPYLDTFHAVARNGTFLGN